MLIHPHKVIGDLLDEENIRLMVALLAPLLFLPVLAPRYLVPALPLQALYLVADVPVRGNGTNEFGLPLSVFAFVAATFALARMGRRSIERVVVDRRVLIALSVAALGFFCTDALNSPYERPWKWGREDASDRARHDVTNAIAVDTRVRGSATVLPLLAERPNVYLLGNGAGCARCDARRRRSCGGDRPGRGVDARAVARLRIRHVARAVRPHLQPRGSARVQPARVGVSYPAIVVSAALRASAA